MLNIKQACILAKFKFFLIKTINSKGKCKSENLDILRGMIDGRINLYIFCDVIIVCYNVIKIVLKLNNREIF